MKVLHLLNTRHRRGAEMFAVRLAGHLDRLGFQNQVAILRSTKFDSMPKSELPAGTEYYSESPVPGVSLGGFNSKTVLRLWRTLRRFRPDIVIGHGTVTMKYLAVAKFFSPRTRTVYINIAKASDWATGSARRRYNLAMLKKCDHVISVSQYTGRDFRNHYGLPDSKVTVIPNGVERSTVRNSGTGRSETSAWRARVGIGNDELVVVSVGNLSEEKNQADLITGMARLKQKGQKSRLVLVGEGPLRGELEAQSASMGISEETMFTGNTPEAREIMASSDIFVLPSKSEGMPAVLIEAGMEGLPVVSTDVGAASEVVLNEETGLLVEPGDATELEEAIERLANDPGLRRCYGQNALDRCETYFEMSKIAAQYGELFKELTGTR